MKYRRIHLAIREPATQLRNGNFIHRATVALSEKRKSFHTRPLAGVAIRTTAVTTDMHMITARISGAPFDANHVARPHRHAIFHEDTLQVTDDDVRTVAKIDIDMDAESRRGITAMHTHRAGGRSQDVVVPIVRRIEIDVVHGGAVAMRITSRHTLRTLALVSVRERHVNDDVILTATLRTNRGETRMAAVRRQEKKEDDDRVDFDNGAHDELRILNELRRQPPLMK